MAPFSSHGQRPGADTGRIIVESSTDMALWTDITATGTQGESFSAGLIQHSSTQAAPASTHIYCRARVVPAP